MVTNLPSLGILFDRSLVGVATYGRQCWKVFWRAVEPAGLSGSSLWEGDADCNENYYCIAVQSADEQKLNHVKETISQSAEFKKLAGYPAFIEGADCTREPLVDAGRIDGTGNWVGKGGNAGVMLDVVRKEREPAAASATVDGDIPGRPTSPLTSALPKWAAFADLDQFCKRKSSMSRVTDSEFFWIMPEELCDIVESAAGVTDVFFSTYSCGNSSDLCRVALRDKTSASNWFTFCGLYPVPSVEHFVNEWNFGPEYEKMRPKLAGMRGRFVMNFNRGSASGSLNPTDQIQPTSLWPKLYLRRQKFLVEIERDEERVRQAAEEAKRRDEERLRKEAADREARRAVEAKKRGEEQHRRQLEGLRQSQGLCTMCGGRLGFVDRLVRREKHTECYEFHA